MLYVRVTLLDGTSFVSEFAKLRGIGSYSSKVMSGQKAYNVWRVIGQEHPVSGERVLVRERTVINGKTIAKMEEVMPSPDASPNEVRMLVESAFVPKPHIEAGEHGLHTFSAGDDTRPEGVSTTLPYPVHREPTSLRKYVILDARTSPPTIFYLSPETEAYVPQTDAEELTQENDDDDDFRF